MQLIDGRPVFSATDLVGFLACEHLTALELAAAARLVRRPSRPDPELDVMQERGLAHEARYLAGLEAAGRTVTRIEPDARIADRGERLRRAAAATEAAIRRGDDVIYQAVLFDGRWLGYADFLLRVEAKSALGAWSYEIVDTKLARHTKASALLQICSYVDRLARIQGREPEWMYVALGGSARKVEPYRVGDYMAYYRVARRRFEEKVAAALPAYPPVATYPEPVDHCDVCRWDETCRTRRRSDDDLSLVAGIAARQRQALKARGIETRRALAGLTLPLVPPLDQTRPATLERVHRQARLQVEGEDAHRTLYELVAPSRLKDGSLEPNRGLLALPEPHPGDLFFDIEGDPYALDDGIDYLFGVLEPGRRDAGGNPAFHTFWARDEQGTVTLAAEKRAFERLMDLFVERRARDPGIHIYHYAPYEPTALGRLMGRHGTREDEVDALLRGDVLVDLYGVVRQGVRASVESYSIKRLEPLYGYTREIGLRDVGPVIAAFEAWLQAGGEAGHDDEALRQIERYNHDDVVSTLLLRDWLEARRSELAAQLGAPLPRPGAKSGDAPQELSESLARVQAVADRLTDGVPADPRERSPEQHARWLLAQLLSWHRREEKSFWWRYFLLMDDLTDEERIAEREPMAGLEYAGEVGQVKKSLIHRYRFPPQEHAIQEGRDARDPATGKSPGTVVQVDDAAGTVDLSRGINRDVPHPTSLVPYDLVPTKELRASLLRIGEWVADHGIDADGPYRAARDLLRRLPPRAGQIPGTPVRGDADDPTRGAVRVAMALGASTLPIQGPPGSGKTHTGAHMVLALVADGRKVGVTANSHKVIGLLLDEVAKLAPKGAVVRIGQRADNEGHWTCPSARGFKSNPDLLAALRGGELDVVGGTAWVWSREDFAGTLDVLVVDEAGQIALANAVAVSPAARSLILLGDPQQLDQPLTGTHPPGAERSALAHLLDGAATMPPEKGLFLARTWRLHPDVCAFTSEVFYESRLEPQAGLDRQALEGTAPLTGTGVRYVPCEHSGNQTESPEEADAVAALVKSLTEGDTWWTDRSGQRRRVALDDVLVVAAYNAQVGEIARRLPKGALVGTVDKFQGQQAPVSIYSMATSSPADAPRGMEFLYSLNRLNVATSRARCLAALVASPELFRVRCRTPRQMQLANALCRLLEMATASSEAR
ncbi:MAG TPA: TM0106 family RecB-like putative nuclease [Vicinamibacteria bacterium]|nr:TM0106 family RecB-like putative nuclease [Vicinamibacteria bacterium]